MVKATSSSSPSKSANGGKTKTKATTTTKYASKFVCQRMDKIIDKKISSLKSNPKSVSLVLVNFIHSMIFGHFFFCFKFRHVNGQRK